MFFNAIKGTTAGTPGTGAFTPNAASSGYRAWSNVSAGWMGLVRYEDGSNWELTFSFWNGTTLSRSANQLFDSSSGSAISLTSSATAALVVEAAAVGPPLGSVSHRAFMPISNSTTQSNLGFGGPTTVGTATSGAPGGTLTVQRPFITYTSATTSDACAGIYWSSSNPFCFSSTTAQIGGWQFDCTFVPHVLVTGQRLFVGLSNTNFAGAALDPSALVAHAAVFGKDAADVNIQIMTNAGSTATKVDTGIPLATDGEYRVRIWNQPGNAAHSFLLFRMDTGDVFYKKTSTTPPAAGLSPQIITSLDHTDLTTAVVLRVENVHLVSGF